MGLFNGIMGRQMTPEDFAEYVFANYGGSIGLDSPSGKAYEVECAKLEAECEAINGAGFSKRIYLLTVAGDRMTGSLSTKALYLKSQCYVYAGATCRLKAIDALKAYLGHGDWSNFNDGFIQHGGTKTFGSQGDRVIGGVEIPVRNALAASTFIDLAKACEGEYLFKDAYDAYINANAMNPYAPFGIVGAVGISVKMGNYDHALALLDWAKNSPYYTPVENRLEFSDFVRIDDIYKFNIDGAIKDVTDKKAAGYIYKPRKKKMTAPP